jgi:hypothetical protein
MGSQRPPAKATVDGVRGRSRNRTGGCLVLQTSSLTTRTCGRAYPRRDSNSRPSGSEPGALSAELRGQGEVGLSPFCLPLSARCLYLFSYGTMLLLRTRSAIRTHTVRALNAVPPAVGLPGHVVNVIRPLWTISVSDRAGAVRGTALHTCASPESQRGGSNSFLRVTNPVRHLSRRAGMRAGDRPSLTGAALTSGLRRHVYPRPDSNRHWTAPQTVASTVGLRGHDAGSGGFEPPRAASEATMLPLHQLPKGPAGGESKPGRPSSARGEGGPRRSVRGGPQRHPRHGRRPVAPALIAAATGGHRVSAMCSSRPVLGAGCGRRSSTPRRSTGSGARRGP